MSPGNIALVIINWVLALLSLLCVLLLLIGPIGTVISAIIEGSKQLAPGEVRRWKKTKVFGILFGIGIVGLVIILVLWGVSTYLLSTPTNAV